MIYLIFTTTIQSYLPIFTGVVAEGATGGVLLKKVFLKIRQISVENIFVKKRIRFPVKVAKIFKNTYFEEHANDCFCSW